MVCGEFDERDQGQPDLRANRWHAHYLRECERAAEAESRRATGQPLIIWTGVSSSANPFVYPARPQSAAIRVATGIGMDEQIGAS